MTLTAAAIEQRIRDYFADCNSGVVERIAAHFEPDAVHYFPPGMYEGPFRGARMIAEKWHQAVEVLGSYWTVDSLICDPPTRRAVIEWTHFKRRQGVILRGDEWYIFAPDGLIREIRAYYASPQEASLKVLELGGFDYAARGYPMKAVMQETRRILLDGGVVEVAREGDMLVAPDGRRIAAGAATHLPPVTPSKIICAHLNYRNRLEELKAVCPPAPNYFMKPPSCLVGHKGAVIRPLGCKYLNYEGEVAIVIGRAARNITIAEAEHHVAGYALCNDYALHDFRDADRGSMLRVKGADTLGAVGPGLVRGWKPSNQVLRTYVNGKVVQESSLDGMIWSMSYLVADLARMMTLMPGDIIMSGTPANSRPVQPGDKVVVTCDGLGALENEIVEGVHAISGEAGWMPSESEKVLGVALGEQLRE